MNKEEIKELYDSLRDYEKEFYELKNTVLVLFKKEQEHEKSLYDVNKKVLGLCNIEQHVELEIKEKTCTIELLNRKIYQSYCEFNKIRAEVSELRDKLSGLKFNLKMSLITFIAIPIMTVAMFFIAFNVF